MTKNKSQNKEINGRDAESGRFLAGNHASPGRKLGINCEQMASLATCREFVVLLDKILDAGFAQPGASPFAEALGDFLPDVGGGIYPKRPSQMSPADILTFVRFVTSRPQFWVR